MRKLTIGAAALAALALAVPAQAVTREQAQQDLSYAQQDYNTTRGYDQLLVYQYLADDDRYNAVLVDYLATQNMTEADQNSANDYFTDYAKWHLAHLQETSEAGSYLKDVADLLASAQQAFNAGNYDDCASLCDLAMLYDDQIWVFVDEGFDCSDAANADLDGVQTIVAKYP